VKSPRNDTGMDMTNLHRSPPMNQSKTDLGIVNESQLLRFGIRYHRDGPPRWVTRLNFHYRMDHPRDRQSI
jgi:hypothetical protein